MMGWKRREVITLLGGAAATWPIAAAAEQRERMRPLGILMSFAETDPEAQSWIRALVQRLKEIGWDGSNLSIEYRWPGTDISRLERSARELIELGPNLIVTGGTPAAVAIWRIHRSVPVVMVQVADPVELGLVTSLPRPGGNMTGFGNYELSIGGKWLEVLKEIAPNTSRVVVIVDPTNPSWRAYLHAVEVAAPLFKMEILQTSVQTASDIKHAIDELGRKPNSGLIPLPAPVALRHHELIVALAARHGIPAVYPYRYFAQAGGLMSYGVDLIDMYRQSATYVDRILKGEKPANLPVQAPTKLELVINLKTAKALGMEVPATLLARADEVIE